MPLESGAFLSQPEGQQRSRDKTLHERHDQLTRRHKRQVNPTSAESESWLGLHYSWPSKARMSRFRSATYCFCSTSKIASRFLATTASHPSRSSSATSSRCRRMWCSPVLTYPSASERRSFSDVSFITYLLSFVRRSSPSDHSQRRASPINLNLGCLVARTARDADRSSFHRVVTPHAAMRLLYLSKLPNNGVACRTSRAARAQIICDRLLSQLQVASGPLRANK